MAPTDVAVKLERLAIGEVSGVDDPANEIPGFMVTKAAPGFPIGPDKTWDVTAAEQRVRKETGATDAPNSAYAKCFLYKAGDGTKFGDYKFLVCDVVDGELNVMPAAIRAAASRVSGSSLSDTEKASVQSAVDKLERKAGIGSAAKAAADDEDAPTLLARVKSVLGWSEPTTPEGDIDMNAEEFAAVLDERLAPIAEKVEELSKSVEAPTGASESGTETPAPAPEATPAVETEALSAETVAKAIEDGIAAALEPYNEILEKVLDRIEGTEKALLLTSRKSLVGQEGGDEGQTPTTPTVADAITKALRHPSSVRVVEAEAV